MKHVLAIDLCPRKMVQDTGIMTGHSNIKTTLIYAKAQLAVLQLVVRKLEMQIPAASGPELLK